MALLMRYGYVDRILTTNFDLLAVRACALICEFPAIYDFAASQLFKPADIPDRAVVYLHGQRTGFVLINTDEDFKRHSDLLGPVFEDAGRGRLWIVVGYSGENDPVFDHLANVSRFDNGLYWVGYQDNDPSKHVEDRLLDQGKDAFYTRGMDADAFFIALTQKLGIFPPQFIGQPFGHLDTILEMLAPYPVGGDTGEQHVTEPARAAIRAAASNYKNSSVLGSLAQELLMAGKYDEVVALQDDYERTPSPEAADAISWAHVLRGYALSERAKVAPNEEADRLFEIAYQEYARALTIKPEMLEALNTWGTVLADQAERKKGAEADRLLKLAEEKYAAALAIMPDKHEALNNWGVALVARAKLKSGEEADRLFGIAGEKYEAALAIKLDQEQVLSNWGLALLEQGKMREGALRAETLGKAEEKFLQAEALVQGVAAYNLACLAALRDKDQECRTWLEVSKETGRLPSKRHLNDDVDLDSVRDSGWFKELVDGLDNAAT